MWKSVCSWVKFLTQEPLIQDNKPIVIAIAIAWTFYLIVIIGSPKMIVCDVCKDGKKRPVFDASLHVVKTEENKGRIRHREIIKIPLHLCDDCISKFNEKLGCFVRDLRNEDQPVPGSETGSDQRGSDDHPIAPKQPGG